MSTKVKRMDILCNLSRADNAGRPPRDYTEPFKNIEEFETAWREMDLPVGGPKPLVNGDFLIGLGCKPGPDFKVVLGWVYQWQLDGDITTEEKAKAAALEIARDKGML